MSIRKPVIELPDQQMVEILRKKTPAERLSQAFGMWDFAVEMLQANLRREHPDWQTEDIQREIFRRIRGMDQP